MPLKTHIRVIANTRHIDSATSSTTDIATGLQHLEERLHCVYETLATHFPDPDSVLPIFLAPEWSFRRKGRYFNYGELHQILTGLERLSRAFPALMMVPGTILWALEMNELVEKKKSFSLSAFSYKEKYKYEQYQAVVNTLVALYDGKIIHLHHKRNEGFDVDQGKHGYGPGASQQAVVFATQAEHRGVNPSQREAWSAFMNKYDERIAKDRANAWTCEGVEFGADICADHGDCVLQKSGRKVAVHLIIAAGASIRRTNLSLHSKGGLVVLCDGSYGGELNRRAGLLAVSVPPAGLRGRLDPTAEGKLFFEDGNDQKRITIYSSLFSLPQ